MSDSNTTVSGGIGFCGALFITFLVLKLTGTINWSWWWVTAPLWGQVALLLGIVVVGLLFAAVIAGVCAIFGIKAKNQLEKDIDRYTRRKRGK